jgi:ribosomal-protein-alanine N-acetyltransferase
VTAATDGLLRIQQLSVQDAEVWARMYSDNQGFLQPWSPVMGPEFFTLEGQAKLLQKATEYWQTDRGYGYGIYRNGDLDPVGRVTLSNVVRGAWDSCTLGYWVAKQYNSQGIATGAVRLVSRAAFMSLELHRIQAAIMPRNRASLKVIQNARFVREGYARH